VSKSVELPKPGDKIPVGKFHVSELNVRASEPFGDSEEDQQLVANLRRGRIIGPFKARPEGDGYGVVVGRRRFLAKKQLGTTHFTVGVDCLIENMTDEVAREASFVENLEVLRKNMDPVTRANKLSAIVMDHALGVRGAAAKLGLKASTLSEWLKPLALSPKMQEATAKQKIFFTDALHLAKMGLGKERQDELAEVLESEGYDGFKAALTRLEEKRLKRGIPKGKYFIERLTFDTVYRPDMELHEHIKKLAEAQKMDIPEYIMKVVLPEHTKTHPVET